jgi:hypothetical protein
MNKILNANEQLQLLQQCKWSNLTYNLYWHCTGKITITFAASNIINPTNASVITSRAYRQ